MLCLKKKKFWSSSSSSYGPNNHGKNYGSEQGNGSTDEVQTTNSEPRCCRHPHHQYHQHHHERLKSFWSEPISQISSHFMTRVTREASKAKEMAPPPSVTTTMHPVVQVTEDTPPDLLEGTMDLLVVLPSGKKVQTTVERKTPMMDLLIQTATANKINPAGHIVQVRNERGIEMPYKPSTPIGALDTTTIEIVPKNRVNEYIIVKKPAKVANQPFETTFRLQVHLPRNQLHVMRISPKVILHDILKEVCQEKNMDASKYEIRHPVNLDQKLALSATLGDTGLQELTVVSKNSKINSSVSSADIMAMQQSEEGRGCLDGSFKHSRSSVGDSSVSSGSTASGRGISPCRSEDSRSISPLPLVRPKTLVHSRSNLSNCSSSLNSCNGAYKHSLSSSHLSQSVVHAPPRTKKRAAPQPPTTPSGVKAINTSLNSPSSVDVKLVGGALEKPTPRKKEAPREPPKPHQTLSQRQSLPLNNTDQDHSGSNDTERQHDANDAHPIHSSQQQIERAHHPPISKMSSKQSISSSMTNLTSVSSVSTTSLASSTGGSKKRRAPKPPVLADVHPPSEIEEETINTDSEASPLLAKHDSRSSSSLSRGNQRPLDVSNDQNPEDPTEIEVLSPVSSLSSPSNSASGSTSSSPLPRPPSSASITKDRQQPLNTNEAVEPGSSTRSRTSDSPFSSISTAGAPSPSHASTSGSVERSSRNVSPYNDATTIVDQDAHSPSRPSSTNTQAMPMPVPRRRAAPPTPDATKPPEKSSSDRREQNPSPDSHFKKHPMPKPRTRADRKSGEPDTKPSPHIPSNPSSSSENSTNTSCAAEHQLEPISVSQARNPLAKYGVKVFPDSVLKERAERLKSKQESLESTAHSGGSTASHKALSRSSKSSTDEFSDTGSIPKSHKSPSGSLGKSSKPVPGLSKSDYASQGSVRSIKQLASLSSTDEEIVRKTGYESDDLEENLDFFEPAGESPLIQVSSQKRQFPAKNPVYKPAINMQVLKPRTLSTQSTYEDDFGRLEVKSPGVLSESGKGNSKEEDDSKLNRWQNMVSLNEIASPGKVSSTNTSTNRATNPLLGSSSSNKYYNSQLLPEPEGIDEPPNNSSTICHSSGSEASYTDSGVPPTETVTPSPVNLDDVILDNDYHAGSHLEEKFSSEDGEELKDSSRRSSIQSGHSEEWMNILEAKMNKDEEAIEKMFEAVLPPGINSSTPSPTPLKETKESVDDVIPEEDNDRGNIKIEFANRANKRIEVHTDSDDDYYENNNQLRTDDCSEMIETTVELHHVPGESQEKVSEELSEEKPENSVVPRKLSKSESFSHNSEFDEAKMRRKNYKSSRSNAMMMRSSTSSTSTGDKRKSLSDDSEDEEMGELQSISRKNATNDRTVSMSDLTRKLPGMGYSHNNEENSNKKATSLQKLVGEEPQEIDSYKKQLELQFEQWKQDYINQNGGKIPGQIEEKVECASTDQVDDCEVAETVEETDQQAGDETSEEKFTNLGAITSNGVFEKETEEELKVTTTNEKVEDLVEEIKTEPEQNRHKEETLTEEKEEMKSEEKTVVELRKKKGTPKVVYQYAGPPTIKMASWGERPVRTVSVKEDRDYIMGMGQQDSSTKATSPGRIHSFHGTSVSIPTAQEVSNNNMKRDASPTPHIQVNKGWSAIINSPNVLPNSKGAVKSVLTAWKQRLEENEGEKNKPKEGPPAEIDIYSNGSEPVVKAPPAPAPKPEPVRKPVIIEKTVPDHSAPKTVVVEAKPIIKPEPPKVPEKSKTLGSSFRNFDKPIGFSISSMDSNTFPRPKPTSIVIESTQKSAAVMDTVDSSPKGISRASTIDISPSSGSLDDRKKFFQGIRPVENASKESPIPATNLKSNIATIQKVFEKQRMTKMQQMGSQQSLYSDGAVSPVPSLQRNDSLESRQSTLRRQNSIESHSSDSSSVISKTSQNKGSEMVHKLFGRPSSMNNFDSLRRTPSPISSTTSTMSSSTSYERFTPSPTVVDGPNNVVRISTGGYKPATPIQSNIRSVGNKAIIIVNGEDSMKTNVAVREANKPSPIQAPANVSIIESTPPKRSSVIQNYMSTVIEQKKTPNRNSVPEMSPAPPPSASITQIKQNIVASSPFGKKISISKEPEPVKSNGVASSGVPPPPPPPPSDSFTPPKPTQLSLDIKKSPGSGGNMRNSKSSTPSTPSSPDPRSEIFNAIKNSNGNFGLKKTGSSILLK